MMYDPHEEGEFHQQDGWRFKRMPDGSVRIRYLVHEHVIPPNEWASVVAAASARGETAETYSLAKQLHDGQG